MNKIFAILALAGIASGAVAAPSAQAVDYIKRVEAARQEAVATGADTISSNAAAQIKRVEFRRVVKANKTMIASTMIEDVTTAKGAALVAAKYGEGK